MERTKCRRCLMRDLSGEDYERYIAANLRRMKKGERAEEGVYEARLSKCRECGRLDNATCMACGCLVELRAAARAGRCPYKLWDK